ncbi:MAG: hypothetical protein QOF02_3143 [Blastocatellia bacterium]|jgi:uncharacterized protein (TIGR03118 family)|nr:hypothetical protein [Blastocatellia bacterium]
MLYQRFVKRHSRKLIATALFGLMSLMILAGFPAAAVNTSGKQPLKSSTASQESNSLLLATPYRQTNLVSDLPGVARIIDPLLINPWGISMTATSPFWVANQATGTATLYAGDVAGSLFTKNSLVVTIPGSAPTGTVANGTADFVVTNGSASGAARFIFASLSGNITGWNPNVPAAGSTQAQIAASHPGHVYTGLALANNGSGNFLYAADFANGAIDVYDKNYALQPTASFPFADPTIPTTPGNTYHPHNVQAIGGSLYVTYAKVGTDGHAENGMGNGFVRRFNANGVRDLTFGINNGPLDAPWGVTIAPASFGSFGNALLVGNFSDEGHVNAFNALTGAFLGTLNDESGNPISIDELWALTFGNGGSGGDSSTLYFSAGIGEEGHGLFGSLNVVNTPSPSLVQFSSSSYLVNEGTGSISITVTRTGDASGAATVNYATFDEFKSGHANQKSDYQIAVGTLRFNPGETSKTFKILLEDDFYQEGDEEVNLILSNPTGAGLGSPSVADLTIAENDTGPSPTNPIDDAQFFVRQQYLDFLNREPDAGGLAYWTGQITACGANTACVNRRRREVSAAFFVEQEFQQTGFFVERFFKAALGTRISYEEFVLGRSKVQAGPNAENGKEAFAEDFVQRSDFIQKYGPTASNVCPTFVDALINNVQTGSGVNMTPRRNDLINECNIYVNAGPIQRAKVIRKLVEYPEFINAEFNQSFVLAEYFGYLKRTPDVAGFNFWLNQLNSMNPPNYIAMVCAFINSPEYQQRFYSVITHTDAECGVP